MDIQVDLFRAKERTYYMFDPVYLGWKQFALKGVNIHDTPGSHIKLFVPPNDNELGKILQYCLNKATDESVNEKTKIIYKNKAFFYCMIYGKSI
ncbi:MAG: hypothetical protein EOP53_16940 [Sphingobacteriales bacterium]|nr:MAG: hypothetical protein EOP53_16940 [Sphingobacteriales bacterium]